MERESSPGVDAVQSLERRHRALVALNVAVLVAVGAACVASAARSGAREIRATTFVLVDAQDRELGRLSCEGGLPALVLHDAEQRTQARFGVGSARTGTYRVEFRHGPDGDSSEARLDPPYHDEPFAMLELGVAGEGVAGSRMVMTSTAAGNSWEAEHIERDGAESSIGLGNAGDSNHFGATTGHAGRNHEFLLVTSREGSGVQVLDLDEEDDSGHIVTMGSVGESAGVQISKEDSQGESERILDLELGPDDAGRIEHRAGREVVWRVPE